MKFEQFEKISARELETLSLFSLGLEKEEVAKKMNLSQSTVKGYLRNIYRKLNVNALYQAVVWYFAFHLNQKNH